MGCRKVERFLSRGKYGVDFSALPESLERHMENCEECRRLVNALKETESMIASSDPITDSAALHRVRSRVMHTIRPAKPRRYPFLLKPAFAAVPVIFLMIVMVFGLKHGPESPVTPIALDAIDRDAIEESLNDTADLSELAEIDEPLIFAAVASQFDGNLFNDAWDDIDTMDAEDIYQEDYMEELETFQDSDWEALRRYLS